MPRPKGPGAIKFLDKQDEVAMRNLLWRGAPSPLHDKLNTLLTQRAELTVQLKDLHTLQEAPRRLVNDKAAPVMARANANYELHDVNAKIGAAETELHRIQEQIDKTKKEIEKAPRSRKAAFPWQAKAIRLITVHKYLRLDGDCVASTHGATITTDELQKQLRAEGFKVGARELRRFMRQCGVAGRQGKRTDLTSPSKLQFASLSSSVPEKPKLNRELIEQRRAEQAALTSSRRNP